MTQQAPQREPPQGGVKKLLVGLGVAALAATGAVIAANSSNQTSSNPPVLDAAVDAAPVSTVDSSAAPSGGRKVDFSKVCRTGSGGTVPTGSATEADDYYAAMSQEIGLQQFASLDAILSYVGYPLTAKRLQEAPPAELMDPTKLGLATPPPSGSILAARFFAPKITDVSQANSPPKNVGWRKLVRLLPTADSAARKNRIDAAVVLFNFFAPIKAATPFDGADSVNTQVMLIASKPDLSPIYWLDYGKTSDGAPLSKELDAFFDAAHTPDTAGKRAYFVPCGRTACHGGLQLNLGVTPPAPLWDPERAILNYLDTDHWTDRVQKGEDFADLAAPAIFDPGGFDVIRKLNGEMRDQNQRVQPGSVQHRAASHWLDLHASSATYVDSLALRALPSTTNPAVIWNGADAAEMSALKRFNHYCFRCHGSVEFDVFDKSMVLSLRSLLLARLQPRGALADPRATMPPDRDMTDPDRAALRAFITAH